ncbi:aminoglycoside phosphotransferase family protein [Mycolicibacterium goodii]|uniref:Aminoglycoside phosphotransferase family protein n=1 Tax=Mycolicibacterium goodii TaxID=134601 RepID=A0ABS6HZ22_MYCGD|nr:aminoglycoside phosphotransferase family protein [Mycolicibacterium goodii]OKH61841.1 aminoglycoside resistance protein [Mycobacterium sp. SWH-M5]MBU8818993.1 aminoglycoside phosphotransferase family protein [Mycolicibacterium goodii]MBU8827546.1 aminoglycoside phosphotransferase family protein [Mycolicibacterium goodii]MBU8833877.1 aminoglycoside phosphotransferase family protein [Mycolicibacterium goodii]MBU8841160.1 aminoglycoside phosphotransferase family protein [Mycolicibacterium good
MIELPDGVRAMAARGPRWQTWVDGLARRVRTQIHEWDLDVDGDATHGTCSVVVPVRTRDGAAAVLKIAYPDDESEHEHLALRRWGGHGAVRLLRADPHHRSVLLERLSHRNLNELWDIEACEVVAGLYHRLHVPALPQVRSLPRSVARWTEDLAALPRSAPVPRRLVEQAISLGTELVADRSSAGVLIHGDLHYENVLAGPADDGTWLAIDPKPFDGDPHYEPAPMLWNRWDELAGYVREGVRRRFHTVVDAASLDPDRARAWVIVRMMHNAMWELTEQPEPDPHWITTCVAIAKAVQD